MAMKPDLEGLGQKLGDLAARLEESARRAASSASRAQTTNVFKSILQNLRHLFSHGITEDNLRGMLKSDVRDTISFYTREIDLAGLRTLPSWKRWPLAAWKTFTAAAYRLSPPRRLVFVIAVFSVLLGALQFLAVAEHPVGVRTGITWWAISLTLLILLLLMEVRDKLDLKGDLEVAREIQLALVPSGPYERGRVAIYSFMRTANTVGGDYHDIIALDDKRIALIVGDVAGKGMPAALLMALLQGSLRTLVTAGLRGAELIGRLNQYLCVNIPANRLVTLFYAELDCATGAMRFVNAGHNPPLLLRTTGAMERLEATSVVLGVFQDVRFEEREAQLQPGDRLLLYTDGLTEVFNLAEEEYGEERLSRNLQACSEHTDEDLVRSLIADALQFCGEAKLTDDITLVSLRMRGAA